MTINALVRARPSKSWSVHRIVELNFFTEQIGILKASALDHAAEDIAQIGEDGLSVMRGKHLKKAFCFRVYAP